MIKKANRLGLRKGLPLLLSLVSLTQLVHAQAFVHPGLLHTQTDFNRMASNVAAKANPWIQGYEMLNNNPRSQTSWNPRPVADVDRGGSINNYGQFFPDVAAAYQSALQWKITGNVAYANQSIRIMNAWSAVLTQVTGDADRFLAAGIYGYEFANAAEIMRTYSGWAPADFARFQNMMMTVFYPMNHDFLVNHNTACIWNYWANWDLCNIASIAAIGVLCDNRSVYNEALTYFKQPITANAGTNGGQGTLAHFCWAAYPGVTKAPGIPTMIQGQEESRDQGHGGLDMALLGVISQQFYNQGNDMFAYTYGSATQPGSVQSPGPTNAILAACEYFAAYNISPYTNTVPFTTYWTTLGTAPCGGSTSYPGISPASRGDVRPAWELIYSHYVGVAGAYAPFSTAYAAAIRPEGGGGNYGPNSGGYDQLGFGTLAYTVTAGNPVASGYYTLQNRTDSNYLDDYGFTTNGSPVNQYGGSGSVNQQWYLTQVSGSTYTLTAVSTGLLLDSLGHSGNGSTVGQWTNSGSPNQQWTISNVGGGYYKIKNNADGLYLDTGGLTTNGATMQMWGNGGSYNQQWFLHAP